MAIKKGAVESDMGLAHPNVHKIDVNDLKDALMKGIADFNALPTFAAFLCIIYPFVGLLIARAMIGYDILPLLWPMIAGYALIGPLAAIGLYELSRRRELGRDVFWTHIFDVIKSPSIIAIGILAVMLLILFFAWILTAYIIYQDIFGTVEPTSIEAFLTQIFTTPEGWRLITIGSAIGFAYAVIVLSIGVVSFPMLVDREVSVFVALTTSVRAVAANPLTMALWGFFVAGTLFVASLPLFLGLAVALPVIGHATWHLYRKVVET